MVLKDIEEVENMILKYRSLKNGMKYLIFMFSVFFLIFIIVYLSQRTALKRSISEKVITDIEAYAVNIDEHIVRLGINILLMDDIISNKEVLVLDESTIVFSSEEKEMELQDDLYDWMETHQDYDQIRIIGLDGMEVLRINNEDGVPIFVETEELQNKSNRYYFENAIALDDDYIYLSKIDLNVENDEVEYINDVPKQMLRIATPLYNSENEKIGLLIINYYSVNLFHDYDTNQSEYANFEVINQDGYYLHNQDESLEFGFMFDDKEDNTVYNKHGIDIDFSIVSNGEVLQKKFNDSLVTYLSISNSEIENAITDLVNRDIGIYSDNGDIFILGCVNLNSADVVVTQRNMYFTIFIIFSIVIIPVSKLLDELTYSLKQRIEILEYTATHDSLTNLINRKGIFTKLDILKERNDIFSILYLDLDGFKKVNDNYGHNIGDLLLIETANRLSSCLRDTDIVARLGGDEFLIYLKDVDNEKNIKKIMINIQNEIKKEFIFDDVTCFVDVSIGFAINDNEVTIDYLVSLADQQMYQDKGKKKNLLN